MERRTFIKTIALNAGTLMLGSNNLFSASKETIKLLMIYNNAGEDNGLKKRWGLSTWIDFGDEAILFDVGKTPEILWKNIEATGIDIQKLSKIVISHNHKDHIDGLPIILEKARKQPKVLVPNVELESIRHKFPKADLVGVDRGIKIRDYLWSTGEMEARALWGSIWEQSIVISQNDSMIMLTGCAHPGVVEIAEEVKKQHPGKKLKLVSGGFHLMKHSEKQILKISSDLKKLGVENIAPSHCTGDLAMGIFKDQWKERYVDFCIGKSLEA